MAERITTLTADEARRRTLVSLATTGPEHFHMGDWLQTGRINESGCRVHTGSEALWDIVFGTTPVSGCGTTACIAGHAAAALRGTISQDAVVTFTDDEVANALGVETWLFYAYTWPLSWSGNSASIVKQWIVATGVFALLVDDCYFFEVRDKEYPELEAAARRHADFAALGVEVSHA